MKQLFILCLLYISIIGYAQKSDFCHTYPSGKTLCFFITSSNTVIIGENSNSYDGRYSFEGSLSIPESVTDRGDTYVIWNVRGFQHSNLTSVKLSEKVTVIGSHAFWDCKKLTNINFPNSLVQIKPCAFEGCSSLTYIKIPNSIRIIGRRAFKNTGLTSVVIPATVEQIGRSTFESCHNLKEVTIGCNRIIGTENVVKQKDDTNSIDWNYSFGKAEDYSSSSHHKVGGSFENCENLQKVILNNSVTHIGARTFSGCTNLREINIPNSVTYIGWHAFENCVSLRDIVIPEGVTSLGADAFSGCRRLRTIKLPASLVKINRLGEFCDDCIFDNDWYINGMFYNCPSLEKIIIPVGSYEKFAKLLPDYKDKFVEEEEIGSLDGEILNYKSLYGKFVRDKQFAKYILNNCSGWKYIYLDNDTIPELLLYGDCEAAGCCILSVQKDTVIEEWLSSGNCYIPKSGLLCRYSGNMGSYSTSVIQLNQSFSHVIELKEEVDLEKVYEIQEQTGNYNDDYEFLLEKKYTTYYCGDHVITEEEYHRSLSSAYDPKGKSICFSIYDEDKQNIIHLLFDELRLMDLGVIYSSFRN